MADSLIWFAILLAAFSAISTLLLAANYRRLILEIQAVKPDERAQLPQFVRELCSSRFPTTWQSQLFQEVAFGDISWSTSLPLHRTVRRVRQSIYLFSGATAATLALLFAVLLITR